MFKSSPDYSAEDISGAAERMKMAVDSSVGERKGIL
jgi:hypothetical protein